MKTLGINRKIIVSIFTIMTLIYGIQGISYGQENLPIYVSPEEIQDKGYKIDVPIITPGETNTSLIVSIITFLEGAPQHTYRIQLRRQSPQGEWVTKCIDPNLGKRNYPPWYYGNYRISAIFTNLEPGITYEARSQDTNLYYECVHNPPNPDPWSPIAEGTTLLENPPLAEFFDLSLAVAVRATLELPINNTTGAIDILKIPLTKLTKLTKLNVHPTSLAGDLLDYLDLPNITDLTGLEHATQLRILDLTWHTGVTDLDPIAQLTQLRELNIYRTNVIDLTPIAQLTQLSKLDISGTGVFDLTPIAQLTQLKELRIKNTGVTDLTPLSGLTQLSKLDMWGTPINDLTPLAQLTRLTEIRITVYTTIAASDIRLLEASTPQPLTEATLNGSSVILTLLPSGVSYDKSIDNLRNALTVSGIPGVIVSDVTRVNDAQVKVTLEFTGNLSLPDTLTFTISPEAVSGYDGRVLTDKITIYAPLELSVSHDTLTDVTLDGAIVTLTLASGAFHSDRTIIRPALTITGIPGIGIAKWSEIEIVGGYSGGRKEIKIKLTFTGDPITTDSILTLTVGPRAILNYNGPAYTLEIPVSAVPEAELSETELAELSKALVASTDYPLTATSLDGAIVTLRLTDGVYERESRIEDALTISGIQGVTFGTHYSGWGWYENDVNRVSDTEITIEFRFAGSINADSTLIFTVGPEAIADYNGPARTAELPVSASSEIEVTGELVASTVFPLSANTLHGNLVKLTLKTKSFQGTDDAPHVKTSGVPGVSLGWGSHINILNKKEARVLLSFSGNLDTDATLILSVPSRLIENYTGPPISAELPVTAKRVKQAHISEPSLLIYTDTDKIQLSPSGSVVQYESVLQKTGLTVDAGEGKVYWSEQDSKGGTIKRANLDLTGVEVLGTLPINPYRLSINTVGKNLYWINSSKREIQSAVLNGENIQTVIDLDSNTTNIAVDGDITDIAVVAEGGKLYWADKYSIWNVNLDGTNAEIAVTGWGTSRTTGIGGIAIADGKIYWTGHQSGTGGDHIGSSTIHRANLNGTSTERLASTYGKATSIAVDTATNKVYWANLIGGIQRVDIDGGEVEAVVSGITAPGDFVVVPSVQPTTPTTPETPATTDATVSISLSSSIPAGISLIHVPLKVTAVDGVEQIIESIADLYDALGGASTVNFLITYDSQTQEWRSYFGTSDTGTPADKGLTDDTGIIAGMKVSTSVRLSGDALGTDGSSTITLTPGLNLVGLPLRDSRITRVSDLFALDGIGGNVPVIILTDGGEFKAVGRADDPGDIEITGGQSFILTAQRAATVAISGEAWINVSGAAAAPPVSLTGIEVGDTTPVLELRGSIVDEETGLKVPNFRVTVKNLSTSRAVAAITSPDEAGYRSTVVDIETGRAATIGDILEISAQSPDPLIGVKPLRYTVTAEDVKQSLIQLPNLVAYEIPAEAELLANYPNPFNPETWIPYRLAEGAFVTLTIYDLNGQNVRTLDVGYQVAAVYESRSKAVYWDGRNGVGEQVASGVYFYHLSAGEFSATRKMLILK